MSITNGLREYVSGPAKSGISHICENAILHIADRIDAEHEKAMSRAGQLLADVEKDRDYNYAYWQDCKQKVLQGNITIDELYARIESLKDELSHCIELPKDADGEYIHIGDMVENNERVVRIVLTDGSWEPSVYIEKLPNVLHEHFCNEISHYHEPTVEDVLREILCKAHIYDEREMELLPDLIAEYAAKLRLADDKE